MQSRQTQALGAAAAGSSAGWGFSASAASSAATEVGRLRPPRSPPRRPSPRRSGRTSEVLESHADPRDIPAELSQLAADARVHVLADLRRQVEARRAYMQRSLGGRGDADGSLAFPRYRTREAGSAIKLLSRAPGSGASLSCGHQSVPRVVVPPKHGRMSSPGALPTASSTFQAQAVPPGN